MAETKKTTETKAVKSSETKTAAKTTAAKKTTTAAKAAAPKATAKATATKTTTTKATATKKAAPAKVEAAPVAEVKVEVKAAPKAKKGDMIKVTLVKSGAGRLIKQKRTLEALGLRKTNSSNIVPDNAATRGMIFVVKHLVSVEKV